MADSDRACYASRKVQLDHQTATQYQAYGQPNSNASNHSSDADLSFYKSVYTLH